MVGLYRRRRELRVKAVHAVVVFLVFLSTCAAVASPDVQGTSAAGRLFTAGRFEEAAAAYRDILKATPTDTEATRRLGVIELYRNHLDAASGLLSTAQRLDPSNAAVRSALAEVARRRAEAGKRVAVAGDEATVPFVMRDPLPAVRVRINGTRDATFLIDTGAPDIVLSAPFAKELGVKTTASGMGTFAGGKHAPIETTTVQSIALGGATAYDVAAKIAPVPAIVPNVQIDGIVGTGLMERFLATLDYPHGRLILRRRSTASSETFQRTARDTHATVVPFWLVGDHFVFATARVNDARPGLFLFDSGLAGGGLLPSTELIATAHIKLDEAHAGMGMGGGGPIRAVPFAASSITVGDVTQHDVPGIYSPDGSPFGIFPFTVQGAISHEFLKHYAYTVDFDAMNIVLAPL